MNRPQRAALITLVLASLAAAWLHLSALRLAASPRPDGNTPDLAILAPSLQVFDQQGRLKRQLRATRLEQWPGEAQARLSQPRLFITDRRQQRWQASAENGWFGDNGRDMVLKTAVRLQREPPGKGPVVTTEHLKIADKGDLIESDRTVVLASGNWHFSAKGLRAELGREKLELLGDVRGKHD